MTQETQSNITLGNNQSNVNTASYRCRKWIFTLNNYSDTESHSIKDFLSHNAEQWIFGYEVGENGTPHLQGYMEFNNTRTDQSLRGHGFTRAFLQKARGNLLSNYNYCSKSNTFEYGGFSLEKIDYKCNINNFYQWETDIINILKTKPDERSIHWYWEPNGCAGKTTFQKYIYTHFKNVVVLSGKATDMKNGIVQYKMKLGETPDIILINIPRCNHDFVSYEGIESIKDMFFFSGKYEGGMICGPNPHLFIFANESPDLGKFSKDRWKIVRI